MKRKREGNNDVNIANHDQEGSTTSMDNPYIIDDVDDDPYFPRLVSNQDPISDEKYAEQLQLHEALVFSSASRASTSCSIKTPIVILDSQGSRASTSSIPKTPIVILENKASRVSTSSSSKTPIVILDSKDSNTYESSQVADRFCDICMDTKTESEMFRNTKVCGHMFCFDCIRGHVAAKIQENITKVGCPDQNCKGVIGPEACRLIVPRKVLERWEDALCESLILGTEKFYCPFKDCSALLVDDGGGAVTSSECPHCNRLFCAQCKVTWHSGICCSEYQSLRKDERDMSDLMLMDLAKNKKWKRCPNCNFYVEKIDGCEIIHCRCGHDFDYNTGSYMGMAEEEEEDEDEEEDDEEDEEEDDEEDDEGDEEEGLHGRRSFSTLGRTGSSLSTFRRGRPVYFPTSRIHRGRRYWDS